MKHASPSYLAAFLCIFTAVGVVHCSTSGGSSPAAVASDASSDDSDDGGMPGDDGGSTPDAPADHDAAPSCGASCDGCCMGAQCVSASAATCGGHGSACVSCGSNVIGHACVAGACGCNATSDCPDGTVCDPSTDKCGAPCSASNPCASGCCSQSGVCAPGSDGKACGPSGSSCVDCSQNQAGTACISGGTCGCNAASDCPVGQACDTVAHKCTTTCSDNSPCNGMCCVNSACTSTCTGNANGSQCVGQGNVYHCGCFGLTDCAAFEACDGTMHVCTTTCDTNSQPCNGGCCNNGTCANGMTDAICGGVNVNSNLVGTCTSCGSSLIGGHCAFDGLSQYVCGSCTAPGDCNQPATCQSGHCCLPSGATGDPNNPQYCCSDVVSNGVCQ